MNYRQKRSLAKWRQMDRRMKQLSEPVMTDEQLAKLIGGALGIMAALIVLIFEGSL